VWNPQHNATSQIKPVGNTTFHLGIWIAQYIPDLVFATRRTLIGHTTLPYDGPSAP
jgi:hypothetical protein